MSDASAADAVDSAPAVAATNEVDAAQNAQTPPAVATVAELRASRKSAGDDKREDRGSKKKRGKEKDREKEKEKTVAASGRTTPDGGGGGGARPDGGGDSREDNAPMPPSDGTASSAPLGATEKAKEGNADCDLSEKDMAREAWRKNQPAICAVSAKKAFMLIPIKGSIEGETHQLHRKPVREARVILPAGSESLLTMKQYKVKRLGFKELRVNATEQGGTRLRIKLQAGAGDPVFDVKDGYAKITVATPAKN